MSAASISFGFGPLKTKPPTRLQYPQREEAPMPSHVSVNLGRRAILRAGALILGAALWPLRASAQNKLRIGVIGSGHIGGTLCGAGVKTRHPGPLFSPPPAEPQELCGRPGQPAASGDRGPGDGFG